MEYEVLRPSLSWPRGPEYLAAEVDTLLSDQRLTFDPEERFSPGILLD